LGKHYIDKCNLLLTSTILKVNSTVARCWYQWDWGNWNESGVLMVVGHVSCTLLPLILYMHPEDSANCLLSSATTLFNMGRPGPVYFCQIYQRVRWFLRSLPFS